MELHEWFVWVFAAAAIGAGVVLLRRRRIQELDVTELTVSQHDEVRTRLLDHVRRHSYTMGTWVDLAPFWKHERVRRDGDRLQVLGPLLRDVVLLVPVRTNGIDELAHRAVDWFALELPAKVQLPEIVFRRMYQGEPIAVGRIDVGGDWVMGDLDKSTTHGDRAGRDNIGGDHVGRDSAGRDARSLVVGGSAIGSGNTGISHASGAILTTQAELGDALSALRLEAQARGEDDTVLVALRWAADAATSDTEPDRREQSRHQRVLDRGSDWLRSALGGLAEGVSGALTDHWLVEVLRG